MTITFYTLSKRKNSTKQPAITGTDYTGTLTTASGIVNPSIIMDFGNTAPSCNYAYISEFGRYYWINEITSMGGGLWRVDMSCDVLASFKSSIGNNTKYVIRSASNSDGNIVDMKYPTKTGFNSINVISNVVNWTIDMETGRYVVAVITPGNSNTIGSLALFVLDNTDFQNLRAALAPGLYYNNITDADLKNLAIAAVDPMQYIAWVRYFPFTIATDVNKKAHMYLGSIDAGEYLLLTSNYHTDTIDFAPNSGTPPQDKSLTAHPLAATRGNYLSWEPYTQRFLTWQPIGMIHLPMTITGETELHVQILTDIVSGIADVVVYNGTTYYYRTAIQVGIDVPIAQILSSNPLKVISGAMNLLGAGFAGAAGNVPGAISGVISGITDFCMSTVPSVESFKPGGGIVANDIAMRIIEFFTDVVDDDNLEFGRPLCKAVSISTLSGFVQCADPEVYAVGATAPELEEIGSYMTGGFFYE